MARIDKRVLRSGLVRYKAFYVDGGGTRRSKLFPRRADAAAYLADIGHEIPRGLHTPPSQSPTVKQAADFWIARCESKNLEHTTIEVYRQHVDLHLVPYIGKKKLADLTVPSVHDFADKLAEEGRSATMVRNVIGSLGRIFKEARRRGLASTAPTVGLDLALPRRDDKRAIVPSKHELRLIIAGAQGRARALVLTAIFAGLRASELRGLRWADVDFEARQINVTQRADSSHKIGKLKSRSGYRSIPLAPTVANALKEWRVACPKGKLDLVFPNGLGRVESYANIIEHDYAPIQTTAGIVRLVPVTDDDGRPVINNAGKPVMREVAKYGLHAMRHATAALWIEQGYNVKQIMVLMGHASVAMTLTVYGYLFDDPGAAQKAAEGVEMRLLGKMAPP